MFSGLMSAFIAFFTVYYIPFIAFYILIGAIYAVAKWTISLVQIRNRILLLDREDKDFDLNRKRVLNKILGNYQSYPPKASNNKGLFFFWATFWPISLIWTLIADVTRAAWGFVYSKFGYILDRISKAILPE